MNHRKKYWGAQTDLALKHFAIGEGEWPKEIIYAQALVKIAAARANEHALKLDSRLARAIENAAWEIISGKLTSQIPVSMWQSGSGTQFNMNMNEVIASRANEIMTGKREPKTPVHPNDHVNMSQSTNDTVPTAIHIAVLEHLEEKLSPALSALIRSLKKKSREFRGIRKIGRTHLQDAVELTLGQVFSAYEDLAKTALQEISHRSALLLSIPLGGTAVGTGINTPKGYRKIVVRELSGLSKLKLQPARNSFSSQAFDQGLIALSGTLRTAAIALMKIANDIRFLASGPNAGFGELLLPQNEPGSSIMPGKVNPTQCEAMIMVCAQVIGNDAAVTVGALTLSNFELAATKPLLAKNVLESMYLLADAAVSFEKYCVRGIHPNKERIRRNLAHSLEKVTRESIKRGYDAHTGRI